VAARVLRAPCLAVDRQARDGHAPARPAPHHRLDGLAILAHLTGDSAEAIRRHEEAMVMVQELGDPVGHANIRRHLGMHYLRQGWIDEAERELQMARTIYLEHVQAEPAFILRGLAEVYLARGDLLAAADYAEQAFAGVDEGDRISRATHGATLGKVRAAQGRGAEAEALFRESLAILEASEYRIDLALTQLKYGEALLALERPGEARQALERARGLFVEMGATQFTSEIDARLAVVTA
jgi:tetratricopeptide (TPR) repeat protein